MVPGYYEKKGWIMIEIRRIEVGDLACNCYVILKNDKALVIDPGDDYDLIKNELLGKEVLGILITHHHFDHVEALNALLNEYKVDVFDKDNLKEGKFDIDEFHFEVIYTPGHTSDSVTYYFKDDKVMFTGDFVFKNSIGRCDLPTGDFRVMLNSIEKIKKYDDDIVIYPGHGEKSTLGYEKTNNEYFNLK